MLQYSLYTQDEREAMDRVQSKIRNHIYEVETGMPAMTQWMQPADAGG